VHPFPTLERAPGGTLWGLPRARGTDRMRFRRPRAPLPLALAVALAGCLLAAPTALANMASPVRPGDAVGEPAAGLEGVTIERERLLIDLQPLAGRQPALVEATYQVQNGGAARVLPLLFVADGLAAGGGGVWLDDAPISAASSQEGLELPASWRPPTSTPDLAGGRLSYATHRAGAIRFALTLPPGRHTIRVRYAADPTAHSTQEPTIHWQLGYVLAPARRWAGFGGLDLEVRVPPGWRAVADPPLERRGETLVGSWPTLPADALGLTVQAPPPSAPPIAITSALAGLALCLLLGWLTGAWLGRRRRSAALALPIALLLGVAWAAAVPSAIMVEQDVLRTRAGDQLAWTYGYGEVLVFVGLVPLLLLVGLVLAEVAALLGRRQALARPSAAAAAPRGQAG